MNILHSDEGCSNVVLSHYAHWPMATRLYSYPSLQLHTICTRQARETHMILLDLGRRAKAVHILHGINRKEDTFSNLEQIH